MPLRYQKYIDCLKLDESTAIIVDTVLKEIEDRQSRIMSYYLDFTKYLPCEQVLQILTYVEQVIVMCSDKYQEHVKMYLDSCQKHKFLFGFNIECFNDAPYFRDYDGKLLQEYLM